MISDVLFEAVQKIREYLADPTYAKTYSGEVRSYLSDLTDQMDKARAVLDAAPPPVDRAFSVPAFVELDGGHFGSVAEGQITLEDGRPILSLRGRRYRLISSIGPDPDGGRYHVESWKLDGN